MVVVVAPSPENRLECGVICSKKYSLLSVVRNRARRRIREVYRINEDKLTPGWDIVLVCRSKCVDAEFSRLTRSFLTLAKKAGILAPAQEVKP